MTLPSGLPGFEFLSEEEAALLAAVADGNRWLRAVLCTLARRGVAYRQADPRRAQELLRTLAPLPYYKGGQFLFDLMEWEDFMLDGPPPPIVPTTLDAPALSRVARLLNQLQQHLDGNVGAMRQERASGADDMVDDDNLPPLEPGLYLYQDVVLGIVVSVLRSRPAADPTPAPEPTPEREKPPARAPLALSLDPAQAEVAPGEQEMVRVLIQNNQDADDRVSLSLQGLPSGWYSLTGDELALPAGAQTSYLMVLHPPRSSASAARAYTFQVRAVSAAEPDRAAYVSSVLIIQPFSSLFVEVRQ